MFTIFLFIYHLIAFVSAHRSDYVLADDMVIDCGPLSTSKVGFLEPVSPLSTIDAESKIGASSRIPGPILFQTNYTYTCIVPPGPKIIQFQFYPTSLESINKSEALFTIRAGKYTLLTTSASSYSIGSQGQIQHAIREFCINVDHGRLHVTFTPSSTPGAYAFVNKIKVVSVPTSLYVRGNDEVPLQIRLIGHNPKDHQVYILNNSMALETMYRVNVGGPFISPDLDGSEMLRTWSTDETYLNAIEDDTHILQSNIGIKYSSEVPAYTAPVKVYTTTRALYVDGNTSWSFPLDSGFYYLIRFHFCEISKKIKLGERVFKVYINYQTAENLADVIQWSNGAGLPVRRDYVVDYVSGHSNSTRNLVVAIENNNSELDDHQGILNGLEIFKISDTNNNLAGAHPFGFEVDQYQNIPTFTAARIFRRIGITFMAILFGVLVLTAVFHSIKLPIGQRWGKQGFLPWHCSSDQYYCRNFSLAEMKSATNNFCQGFLIGSGGFGKVYKGYIGGAGYTATTIAIKRANPTSKQGLHEFQTEITMLSKLRHHHLVSLIGYCKEDKEMILVYDYMAQGTLRDHLYGKYQKSPLPWKQRIKICIGAARGLHYLHTGANEKIIHRDVKSSNILLDKNLAAKVSDFGLSKVGPDQNMISATAQSSNGETPHVSTEVKGSFGYLDPEYYRRQKLTEKSDVYSFGVVLFEVVCARPAVISVVENGEPEQVNLSEWALQHCNPGQEGKAIDHILDPSLLGKINSESLKTFTDIARQCLTDRGSERPSMGDVLWKLEVALQQQERADQVENNRIGPSFPTEIDGHKQQVIIQVGISDPTPGLEFSEMMLPTGR
ncbi:receptor-like protein kinase FERONIA [Rosa rugosa]|uniref:receptor-like protein kinase FERONIA n=1 Tax=Rosa rugosa TaxID=74645 RepID=UPI002B405D3B|nr:receptor-like protein kinase FERONIA [Rosa rugosa]